MTLPQCQPNLLRAVSRSTLLCLSLSAENRSMTSCADQSQLNWWRSSFALDAVRCHSNADVLKDYAARELNALLWLSLITITALLLRKVLKLLKLWVKAASIPGPQCPSFYGHSALISRENLTDLLSESHEKYGSVVKLWLGPTQLLVSIRDPALIKEMLLKAEDKLPLTGRAFSLAFGKLSLFASSFDKVYKRRESLATKLNGKLFEGKNIIPTNVVECVMERIHSVMDIQSIDCKTFSQHLAFTMLGATMFGDEFLAWSEAAVYEELLMKIAKDACFWASYSVIPFWKQGFWKYQCLCTKLRCLTQDIIQHCRQNYKQFCRRDKKSHDKTTTFGQEAASDAQLSFSGVMLDKPLPCEFSSPLNAKEEPCGNIMSVMFHGCLTTASLIGNILTRLAIHPDMQDKIYSEINMVQKGSQKQDLDINRMLFLLATVYESARLLPAGPLLQRCSLKRDLNLRAGVAIPAGAILVVPIQLVQTDYSSWGSDASQFNPYRFLSKAGKGSDLHDMESSSGVTDEQVDSGQNSFVLKNPTENAAFLPFGSGVRSCVGQKYAILGIATVFASLLEHYEVRLLPESENDLKQVTNGCVFQFLPSTRIAFVRRNGQNK